jgi:hypothetical protein
MLNLALLFLIFFARPCTPTHRLPYLGPCARVEGGAARRWTRRSPAPCCRPARGRLVSAPWEPLGQSTDAASRPAPLRPIRGRRRLIRSRGRVNKVAGRPDLAGQAAPPAGWDPPPPGIGFGWVEHGRG